MKYVTIPKTDLHVSQICFGTAEFGACIGREAAFHLLDAFVADGGSFIDTAHVYSDWIPNTKSTSEKYIGEWLRASGMRDDIVIGTKGAHPLLATMQVSRLSAADIAQDINESLAYLQTDRIDLYWLHRDDVSIPVGEIIDVLNEHVKRGAIRYFGCSNWLVSRIQAALDYAAKKGIQSFVANQPLWGLAVADMKAIPDKTLVAMDAEGLDFHKRTQLAAIPYSSQSKGFFSKLASLGAEGLSKADRDVYLSDGNAKRLLHVQSLAHHYDVAINDIALGYLLSQPFTTIPVVGCRSIDKLKSSLKAVEVVLTSEDISSLEAI